MFANTRMYSVSPAAAAAWRHLFTLVIEASGMQVSILEYPAPAPLEELWRRPDQAAVFMCGLPFSRTQPPPVLLAAPVPAATEFAGRPEYFSEFVVRRDDPAQSLADTYGRRLALTVPESQSGCAAALSHCMTQHSVEPRSAPLFAEIVAPTITPLGALSAVVEGDADVAPIDAYAMRLLAHFRPEVAARVRVVARTAATPIPPLVASSSALEPLAHAFARVHDLPAAHGALQELQLRRFARPDPGAYTALRDAYRAATAYWRTHRLAARTHPAFDPLTFVVR